MTFQIDAAFGERVKARREGLGLSIHAVAGAAGMTWRGYTYVERGIRGGRIDTLVRLARALRTSPNDLLDWPKREDSDVL